MLRLSHEFIKILDEKMDRTSDYMLYVKCEKGNIDERRSKKGFGAQSKIAM